MELQIGSIVRHSAYDLDFIVVAIDSKANKLQIHSNQTIMIECSRDKLTLIKQAAVLAPKKIKKKMKLS